MIFELSPDHTPLTNGDLKICGNCVYKILDSQYVTGKDAHLEVEAEDVTETEAGQAFIAAAETDNNLYRRQKECVSEKLGEIQDYGILVELVDGKMLTQPDGEDLSAMFDLANIDAESGHFIWLQPKVNVHKNYL